MKKRNVPIQPAMYFVSCFKQTFVFCSCERLVIAMGSVASANVL